MEGYYDRLHPNLATIAAHAATSTWDDPAFLTALEEVRSATCTLENVDETLISIRNWDGGGFNGFGLFVNVAQVCPVKNVVFKALWVLTNVTSGSSEHCQELVALDVVPLFIEKLSDEDMTVVEQAGWGLGNLAGDGVPIRDAIHDAGGVAAALRALDNPLLHETGRQNITWAVTNLCRGKPPPRPKLVTGLMEYFSKDLRMLVKAREAGDVEFEEKVEKETIDILWGVSYLTDGDNQQVQLGIDILPLIVDILSVPQAINEPGYGDAPVVERKIPCEQMSYTMEFLPREHLERLCMLNSDIWNCSICTNRRLYNRLRSTVCHKKEVRVPAVRIIGNIMTGTDAQTQAAIDCGALRVIECLIPSLQNQEHTPKNEFKEICWLLSNVTAGTPEQCRIVLQNTIFYNFILEALRMEESAIGKEASWVVSNAVSCIPNEVPIGMIAAVFGHLAEFASSTNTVMIHETLGSVMSLRPNLFVSLAPLVPKMDDLAKTFTPAYLKALTDNYTRDDLPSSLPDKLSPLLRDHIIPVLFVANLLEESDQIGWAIEPVDGDALEDSSDEITQES